MLFATLTASLVTTSAWFGGVLAHGLLDVRHGAISFAAIGREVNDSADAVAPPIERTRIRVLASAPGVPCPLPAMQLSVTP